jgi:hypothetical protein
MHQRSIKRGSNRAAAKLAAWLGPWAGQRVPSGVTRDSVDIGVRAYVYRPRRARGVYLIAQGLHYAGADDPRLDRFCRVLANAGFVVVAPFLRDYCSMVLAPRATEDLALGFAHARAIANDEHLDGPAVFSISFGSRPAIELCARERASALVVFGGYCDFDATVRFAVNGNADAPHDPLNAPVVFLNLLPFLDLELDRTAVADALRRVVTTTWGRPELKVGVARAPYVEAAVAGLGVRERDLVLVACGLLPGAVQLLDHALERARERSAWLDPRPHLARVLPPVIVVHGRDDDVIPFGEAAKIASALPAHHPCEVVLTGLYGHTGSSLPRPREIAREVQALVRVVTLLSRAPHARTSGTSAESA